MRAKQFTLTASEALELAAQADEWREAVDIIYPDYSGRGMWPETCLGFVVENPIEALIRLTLAIKAMVDDAEELEPGEDDAEIARWEGWYATRLLDNAQMDSMGLRHIIYFPRLTVEESMWQDEEN